MARVTQKKRLAGEYYFNPLRLKMTELYQQKKTTVKDICDMLGITKPTLYKAIEEISAKNPREK